MEIYEMSGWKGEGFNVNRVGGGSLDQVTAILDDQPFYRFSTVTVLERGQKIAKYDLSFTFDDIINTTGGKNILRHELRMGATHHYRPADSSDSAGDGKRLARSGCVGRNPYNVGPPDIRIIKISALSRQILYNHFVTGLFKAGGNVEQANGGEAQAKRIKYAQRWRIYQQYLHLFASAFHCLYRMLLELIFPDRIGNLRIGAGVIVHLVRQNGKYFIRTFMGRIGALGGEKLPSGRRCVFTP